MSMETLSPEGVPEESQDHFIIDMDFHITPSIDDVFPYIQDNAVSVNVENYGASIAESSWDPRHSSAAEDTLQTHGSSKSGEEVYEAASSLNIDVPVVTPGTNFVPKSRDGIIKNELCKAYNDYMLEEVASFSDNIKITPILPQWDTDAGVREIDRIGDRPEVCAFFGTHSHQKLSGSSDFDPMYDNLVTKGLPLILHVGGPQWPTSNIVGGSIQTWSEYFGSVSPALGMMHMTNMITTGVFDKFPDLCVVFEEVGAMYWVLSVLQHFDELYRDYPEDLRLVDRMREMDQEYLARDIQEYVFDNFYFTTQPINLPSNSRHRNALLEMIHAEETLMYSSDWPHQTFDPPGWVFSDIRDEHMRSRILHENAEEVLRLQ